MTVSDHTPPLLAPNFITEVIERDLDRGRYARVTTRFPPEPNGYLHLGHTFASLLDYHAAQQYGGLFHLRLDDTNPEGESAEFAQGIQDDLRWLGLEWGERLFYASDHFEQYYAYATQLIRQGDAYVDSVPPAEMARLRGTATTPGQPSPYRDRRPEENLDLFARMRAGEFPDGAHVLRARIDLASHNMKLRDPVLYRILRAHHYRQGDAWCIYPMYDFQHPLQDAIEGVTHSLCSLEFVDNRAIYDWLMERLNFAPRPHQYEFGRRNLEYTVVSKRKLRRLVGEGYVSGWDDPRMPTLRAVQRLGVTPEAVRRFAAGISVNRTNRTVDLAIYENAVRDDLNGRAPRVMAVLDPLRVTVTNLDAAQRLALPYWPHDVVSESPDGLVALPGGERVPPELATRDVPLTPDLYIERADFAQDPPAGFKRLRPGGTVRLRGGGLLRCDEAVSDDAGKVAELRCSLVPEGAKAAGVIHWVSASQGLPAEFRLYDRLFRVAHPEAEAREIEDDPDGELEGVEEQDFLAFLNPDSLKVTHGFVEPSVAGDPEGTRYQFERSGYFWRDPIESRPDALVFNRIITLRDTWGKDQKPEGRSKPNVKTLKAEPVAPVASLGPEQAAEAARLTALGVGEAEASTIARDAALGAYLAGAGADAARIAGWVAGDLAPAIRSGENRVPAPDLAALAALQADGTISARIAKEVLAEAQASGEAPAAIVERKGLRQVSDTGELEAVIGRVLADNPAKLAEYKAGRTGLLGFFTGQVMRATGGQANPQLVAELLGKALG